MSDDKSLEDLVSEFQQSLSSHAQPKQAESSDDAKYIRQFVEGLQKDTARKQLEADVDASVGFLREVEGADALPKRLVRGFLDSYAAEDPEFARAFEQRGDHPKAWKQALENARKVFADDLKSISSGKGQVSDDVQAAKAAVSGSRPEAVSDGKKMPKPAELGRMSGSEWQRFLDSQS